MNCILEEKIDLNDFQKIINQYESNKNHNKDTLKELIGYYDKFYDSYSECSIDCLYWKKQFYNLYNLTCLNDKL